MLRQSGGGDFRLEFRPNVGSASECEPEIGEERGSGISACEENVEEFAADADGVCSLADESVDEEISFRGLLLLVVRGRVFFCCEELISSGEAFLDVRVDEIVYEIAVFLEAFVGGEEFGPVAPSGEVADELVRGELVTYIYTYRIIYICIAKTYILTLRKRLRKPIIPILDQRIGGFPKQKLRRTINGETKKSFTQIDFLARNNRRN